MLKFSLANPLSRTAPVNPREPSPHRQVVYKKTEGPELNPNPLGIKGTTSGLRFKFNKYKRTTQPLKYAQELLTAIRDNKTEEYNDLAERFQIVMTKLDTNSSYGVNPKLRNALNLGFRALIDLNVIGLNHTGSPPPESVANALQALMSVVTPLPPSLNEHARPALEEELRAANASLKEQTQAFIDAAMASTRAASAAADSGSPGSMAAAEAALAAADALFVGLDEKQELVLNIMSRLAHVNTFSNHSEGGYRRKGHRGSLTRRYKRSKRGKTRR
jgi:hypothetical protein